MNKIDPDIPTIKTITGKIIPAVYIPPEKYEIQRKKTKIFPKHEHIKILTDNGLTAAQIAKSLNLNKGHVYNVRGKMRRTALTKPSMVKSAVGAVKKIIKGETWGEIKEIKASDVMNASKEVLDRVEPKITRHQSLNVNIDFDPVDLSLYQSR